MFSLPPEAGDLHDRPEAYAQGLRGPMSPPVGLAGKPGECRGQQALAANRVDITGRVAPGKNYRREVYVLGKSVLGPALVFLYHAAPDNAAGAAENREVSHVLALQDRPEEQVAHHPAYSSDHVFIIVALRVPRLHKGSLCILHEDIHRGGKEIPDRHVVRIEQRHDLSLGMGERVVQGAGFVALPLGAVDVLYPVLSAISLEGLHLFFILRVVGDYYLILVLRVVLRLARLKRLRDYLHVLVIDRHHNRDKRPAFHFDERGPFPFKGAEHGMIEVNAEQRGQHLGAYEQYVEYKTNSRGDKREYEDYLVREICSSQQ